MIWLLNMAGLIVSILGSILLFFGTPYDNGGIVEFAFGDDQRDAKQKKIKIRAILSKSGFLLLMLGFVLQLISLSMQKP